MKPAGGMAMAAALLLSAGGCAPGSEDNGGPASGAATPSGVETSTQALSPDEFWSAVDVAKKYNGYLGLATSFYNFASDFLYPPRDLAAEIDAINARVTELELAVLALGRHMEQRLDAVETRGRHNLVHSMYVQAATALRSAAAGEDTTSMALGAAAALEYSNLYTYTPLWPGGADRFDPRVTAISFMEAVNAWLAVRFITKKPMEGARADLQTFIWRLEWVAQQIRARMTCRSSAYNSSHWEEVVNGKKRQVWSCKYSRWCSDEIDGVTTWDNGPPLPRGHANKCAEWELNWGGPEPQVEYEVASERYFLDLIDATTGVWWDLMSRP